jgi:hypothetical protein
VSESSRLVGAFNDYSSLVPSRSTHCTSGTASGSPIRIRGPWRPYAPSTRPTRERRLPRRLQGERSSRSSATATSSARKRLSRPPRRRLHAGETRESTTTSTPTCTARLTASARGSSARSPPSVFPARRARRVWRALPVRRALPLILRADPATRSRPSPICWRPKASPLFYYFYISLPLVLSGSREAREAG